MAFFKGLAGPEVLPSAQVPFNPHVASSEPKKGGNVGTNVSIRPYSGSIMTGNGHDMLTMFLKIKPPIFLGSKTEDTYEFILNYYETLHKLGIFINMGFSFYSNFKVRPSSSGEFIQSVDILLFLHLLAPNFMFFFVENYVPKTLRDWKKYEFIALEKGGMSLAAYVAKFHAFSRYTTQLVTIEEERIQLFTRGLNSELQVLSIHMTSAERSFNEGTTYVNKVEGVRRYDHAKACLREPRVLVISKDLILEDPVDQRW